MKKLFETHYSLEKNCLQNCPIKSNGPSLNLIGDDQKRRKLFSFLKKQTSDKAVIFMQKIHSTKATEKCFEYQRGGKMLFSHGTSNSVGVCICFAY